MDDSVGHGDAYTKERQAPFNDVPHPLPSLAINLAEVAWGQGELSLESRGAEGTNSPSQDCDLVLVD